jgi:hypothetical protein
LTPLGILIILLSWVCENILLLICAVKARREARAWQFRYETLLNSSEVRKWQAVRALRERLERAGRG